MSSARDVLTPDALFMLNAIAQNGSFAGAAREIGVVPSALSYRVRQMEEALDVLLFSRSSRQAKLTAAGRELLTEGSRLLLDMDSIAHRVKRVATGWESQLTIAVDAIIDFSILMELSAHFFALNPPTRLKLRNETLSGTLAALTSGQADLAVGVSDSFSNSAGLRFAPLGDVEFVFAVAPHHPLAHGATAQRQPHTNPPCRGCGRHSPTRFGPDFGPAGRTRCVHRAQHASQARCPVARLGFCPSLWPSPILSKVCCVCAR